LGWAFKRAHRTPPLQTFVDRKTAVAALTRERHAAMPELVPLRSDELIERVPWTPELAVPFIPSLGNKRAMVFDPVLGARRVGGQRKWWKLAQHPKGGYWAQTNALGMRDDPMRDSADVRILFAGDSQTEGVCGSHESFAHLLEQSLAARHPAKTVDVINAALGGTSPWYYLSTLEAYGKLKPDVFVAVFYGGNDFRGALALERYYRGRIGGHSSGMKRLTEALADMEEGLGAVELHQLRYLIDNPGDQVIAVDTWTAIAMEISRQCARAGIDFVPVYMPPPLAGQPEAYAATLEVVHDRLPEVADAVGLTNSMADRWLGELRSHGLHPFDLRPAFAAHQDKLFWTGNLHLNLDGQAVVAKAFEAHLMNSAPGVTKALAAE